MLKRLAIISIVDKVFTHIIQTILCSILHTMKPTWVRLPETSFMWFCKITYKEKKHV